MNLSKLILAFLVFGTTAAHAAKTFVYCSEGSPSSFNPQIVTDGTSFNASSRPIYNRLVEFKLGETTIVPGLAEKWQISKDGLTYTFQLRKGVKFHKTSFFTPSREFNADDVLFSFNRQKDKNHPFNKVSGGNYDYFNSMEMGTLIKDIIKVNDHEIKFVLTRKEAPFLADLAMDFASILSQEYGEKLQKDGKLDKMDTDPVGTGPFVLEKYSKDQMIRYSAHPDYFRGKAAIEKLVYVITPDTSVRYQKLKTDECQLITYPAPQDLKAMQANPKIAVIEQAGLNVGYLGMNVDKKPFDNVLVRQAVNYALNKKSYIDAVYLGNASVAKNPMPPTIWSYNDKIQDYDYNIEKAKELLKKAGLADGFSTELWTLPVSRPYNPNGKKMGEMMQADLAKVGIKVKLVTYDWPTYLSKSKAGEHALLQMGWTGDNGDPDNFLNVLLSCAGKSAGSNVSHFCDKNLDKLLMQAKEVSDIKTRTKLYEKAQEVFHKEAPWVPLAHATVYRAMSKRVTGYKIDPLGSDVFYGVDLR